MKKPPWKKLFECDKILPQLPTERPSLFESVMIWFTIWLQFPFWYFARGVKLLEPVCFYRKIQKTQELKKKKAEKSVV